MLIAVALAIILLFRLLYGAAAADPPSPAARPLALASLLLWTSVAIAGRMIAYT